MIYKLISFTVLGSKFLNLKNIFRKFKKLRTQIIISSFPPSSIIILELIIVGN